jgi:hypothetical protein
MFTIQEEETLDQLKNLFYKSCLELPWYIIKHIDYDDILGFDLNMASDLWELKQIEKHLRTIIFLDDLRIEYERVLSCCQKGEE